MSKKSVTVLIYRRHKLLSRTVLDDGQVQTLDGLQVYYTVTHMAIARQRLGKHIPEEYALNNRGTSIAK
jgi:hypothetical protein